jgi:DUF438 domain-containing protein
METKVKNLIEYAQGIYRKEDGKALYLEYLSDIQEVTPLDIFLVENEQLKMGLTPKELLTCVDKLINVFYKSLSEYRWQKPAKGTFLYYMMAENKELIARLDSFKKIIKRQNYIKDQQWMVESMIEISDYNEHLLKLENVLFPYLEKHMECFDGIKIMWSLHNDVRSGVKELIEKVKSESMDVRSINVDMGYLFFVLHGLVQKQELILFPSATEVLDPKDFEAMHLQSFDYEFVFIDTPEKPKVKLAEVFASEPHILEQGIIKTETGSLTFKQMENLINVLPVDITFVNENDKVAFFSKPTERIFPRSVAIIGRDVRNCHPPESVHVVEKILKDFKENIKSSESFWIQMKDMFILIQYFALRDELGKYMGTLEVSQEISHIKALEGEKRLLDK